MLTLGVVIIKFFSNGSLRNNYTLISTCLSLAHNLSVETFKIYCPVMLNIFLITLKS